MTRVLLVIAAILLLGIHQPVSAKVFRQYDHGLTFEIPDKWECTEQSGGRFLAVFAAPETRYELNVLSLAHQTLPPEYSLMDYVENTIANEGKMLWQYKLKDHTVLENPATPYHRLSFTWNYSWEQEYFTMQMIFYRRHEVYVLTGTAPAAQADVYQQIFQAVFDSLRYAG